MPRIRSIKPEHWNDKYLPNISLGAHLLWIGMWNYADDKGVIENDPQLLKSNVFPRRKSVKPSQIKKWVDELIKYEFVLSFQHKGIQYVIHRTFDIHQKIDKPQPSKIDSETIRRILSERSKNDTEPLAERSVTGEDKDRIGKDLSKNNSGEPPPEIFLKDKTHYPAAKDFNGLPDAIINDFIRLVKVVKKIEVVQSDVESLWEIFKNQNLTGSKFYQDNDEVYRHFINSNKNHSFKKEAAQKRDKQKIGKIFGVEFINDFSQCRMYDGSIQDLTPNQKDSARFNQINPSSIVKK